MCRVHVLVLPYPAQGHVKPLMELSCELVKHDENRNCLENLTESIREVMPNKLEKLIQEINESDSEKISCVVADGSMGWALELAEKMRVRRALFWPASASLLALPFSIPELLHDGIIDTDGTPAKDQIIHLAPKFPAMRTKHFVWTQISDYLSAQKVVFNYMIRNNKAAKIVDWVICNSTHKLEPSAFAFAPQILPIGPLQAIKRNHSENLAGSFWPEDSTCLNWLDQQTDKSVTYIAFGSFTILDLTQLQELALALELSNEPFLWAVRSDINNGAIYDFLKAFEDRLSSHGKIVGWAPQQKVLKHPSIACFLSHCGWNSTLEGAINGVPFLCWPYFADQFLKETYICDIWKVGLRLNRRNDRIISHEEIAFKIKQAIHDKGFRASASELQEKVINCVQEGGSSNKHLKNFVDWIKA
ncbi:UDP-glycosyltransferase 83A1-like [Prosopis cineraria]|uniref:UDP-glycosyltransferase 83A1-like n=1 Tax=Prosopis cineraria TaxID=364024 RepID=UPI0024108610|nr:UDP-glycosyltransferase 83A1-like [Prosopis cineraria]